MAQPPPRTTVAALLVHPDGRCLLHLRDANKSIPSAGRWSLPGGSPEPGESLDAAIARELLEEADLSIPGLARFAVVEHTGPDGRLTGRIQVYAGTWSGDPASVPLTEGIMLRWTDPGQIPWLTMDPMATVVIAHHRTALDVGPSSGPPLPVLRVRAPGARTVANVVGVHLYAERDGRVLLGLRHPDSPYAPSHHHFLAGHCEQESAIACLVREAQEEAGLAIAADDVQFVHAVHVLDAPGTQPRMQLVFRARAWSGEPRVMEPDKCAGWGWWPADALPEPTVAYARAAIDGIRHGRLYTEMGWT